MLNKVISRMEGFLQPTGTFLAQFSLGLIVLMLLLTVGDVFGRRVLGSSIRGAHELQQMCLMSAAFFTMCTVTIRKGHVTITLLTDFLPVKVRNYLELTMWSIAIFSYSLLGWRLVMMAVRLYNTGTKTAELMIPEWPFLGLLGTVGLTFQVLAVLLNALKAAEEVTKK